MGLQPGDDQIGDPIEEARQMQVSHHEHHREEQYNSSEVDKIESVVCSHGPRGEHQNRPDDGGAWPINLHSRKFSQGEYDVAGNEN